MRYSPAALWVGSAVHEPVLRSLEGRWNGDNHCLASRSRIIQEIRSASQRPAPRALPAPAGPEVVQDSSRPFACQHEWSNSTNHRPLWSSIWRWKFYVCPLVMGYFGNYRFCCCCFSVLLLLFLYFFCKLPLSSTADLGPGIRKGQQLNVDHINYLQVWYQKKNNTIMGECKYIHIVYLKLIYNVILVLYLAMSLNWRDFERKWPV